MALRLSTALARRSALSARAAPITNVRCLRPANLQPRIAPASLHVRFASDDTSVPSGTPVHFKDTAAFKPSSPTSTSSPSTSTRPHEDWVMFHPVYNPDELKSVRIVHHEPKGVSDRIAWTLSAIFRFVYDLVTRYKEPSPELIKKLEDDRKRKLTLQEMRDEGLIMTPKQWLGRFLFLETVAGVPGMVAAMLRHFRSLRMSGRDGGWIHTLLQEAENERMHLMTFMKLKQPSVWFKLLVLGGQGVFANLFFFSYMISPRSAHRFVGTIEEQAVHTYTRAIEALEQGQLPEWENLDAPNIAKDYWRLKSDAKMIDVLYAVRADESNHRFVNHSLANIGMSTTNPFGMKEPGVMIRGNKPGFTKEESEDWARQVHEELQVGRQKASEKLKESDTTNTTS